jgi:glycosyltransferase involved in cell wall biosynthesis
MNNNQSLPDSPGDAIMKSAAVAVLIPCYNEETSIGNVVTDFKTALPAAQIYVYDNNSTDRTVEIAERSGAVCRTEEMQGKGNVVRRMFGDVDADIYVLVDGDDTYDAASATKLIRHLIDNHLDMVCATRVTDVKAAYRPGHLFGNAALTKTVGTIFGSRVTDMLSGYRVFSRRFVKSFPALSWGFETETELTVHALELRMPIAELPTPYKERPEGSVSKLNTIRDGFRILFMIVRLVKEERPLQFYSGFFLLLAATSLVLGVPIVTEFMATGLVPRFPTAILCTGVMILSFLSLACGLILDSVANARREMKRMYYLRLPWMSSMGSELASNAAKGS